MSAALTKLQSLIPDLPVLVDDLLQQILTGQITTYGDLARALGDDQARSARWLGEYLANHVHAADCGCHRVVRANGDIGLYVGGQSQLKAARLRAEGIAVSEQGRADLAHRVSRFHTDKPLLSLKKFQQKLAKQVRVEPLVKLPATLGAVDVAYTHDGQACAAYVLMNAETMEVQAELSLTRPVSFPYIPGYLTYRELPVMLELCQQANADGLLADVLFCDGNGQLHPWRAGIASCLGVLLDHPVIGVGKSLLCGRLLPTEGITHGEWESAQPIEEGGELIGAAVSPRHGSKQIYVSVGNRVTLLQAISLTMNAIRKHRLPEPIFYADRLTKRLKQRPELRR